MSTNSSINENMDISADEESNASFSSTDSSCISGCRGSVASSVKEVKDYYEKNYPEQSNSEYFSSKRKIKLQVNKNLKDLEKSLTISNQKKTLFDCSTGNLKSISGKLFNELDNSHSLPSLRHSPIEDAVLNIKDPTEKRFLAECQLYTSIIAIKRIVEKRCCSKNCLQTNLSANNGMDLSPCYNFVSSVRSDLVGKDQAERHILLSRMIDGSRDGLTRRGHPKMIYKLYSDKFNNSKRYNFCSKSFCSILGMSKGLRQKIRSATNAFKPSDVAANSNQIKIPGGSQSISVDTLKNVKKILDDNKIVLTNKSLSYFVIPDGDKSIKAHAWLDQFFNLVGDKQPNKFDEIHLDSITRKSVWEEYAQNMKLFYGDDVKGILSYSKLLSLWESNFPNVKIREYKNVSGHCKTCERLTNLRATTKDNYKRGLLTKLHAYHRHLYMGERESYYHRQMEAMCRPNDYMSLITDGMNQQHSQVPYLAGLNDFGQNDTLVQHLQLTIEHGQRIDVYRTLGNIKSDRNPAIHALLLQLERRIDEFGFLPPTVYIQIDGGAENANETLLGILALIVARRLGNVRRIVLTRLPVGHTHEDGDGLFGNLWKKTRTQSAESPSAYKKLIEETFSKENLPATVTDIIACPDYFQLMNGCMDPNLSHLWKVEHTKLQWIFEAVNDDGEDLSLSVDYPFGVKCTYRAFVQKENFEIIPVDRALTPSFDLEYRVRHSFHETFPEPHEPPIKVLMEPPSGRIIAKGFVLNSHANLMKTLRKVRSYFSDKLDVIADWETFVHSMPFDDFVENYINQDCVVWHVPFKDELFGDLCVTDTRASIDPVVKVSRKSIDNKTKKVDFKKYTFDPEMFNGLPIQKAKSTASVVHSGNMNSPIPLPRIMISDDAIPSNPAEIQAQFYKWIDRMEPDASVTVKRLQQLLKKADGSLRVTGSKKELLLRLQEYYKSEEKLKNATDIKVQVEESLSLKQASVPLSESINGNESQLFTPHTVAIVENKTQLYEHFKSIMTLISKDDNSVKKKIILEDLEKYEKLITISKNQKKLNKLKLLELILSKLQI